MIGLRWMAILQPNEHFYFWYFWVLFATKMLKWRLSRSQRLPFTRRPAEEHSADIRLLFTQLQFEKSKQDQCHHDTLELQQMLQKEQDLWSQAVKLKTSRILRRRGPHWRFWPTAARRGGTRTVAERSKSLKWWRHFSKHWRRPEPSLRSCQLKAGCWLTSLPRLRPPLLQQEEVFTASEKTSEEKSCWLSTNRPVETTDLRTSVRGRSRGPSADKPREDHHYKALRGRTSGNRRAKTFTSEGGPLPRWGPDATGGATREENSCHQPLLPDTICLTQISEIMHETKANK